MNISVTESYTITTEQYEPYHFSITVGMNHIDLGVSDELLTEMSEVEVNALREQISEEVALEILKEVRYRLHYGEQLSTKANLASRALDYLETLLPADQHAKGAKNGNTTTKPKPSPRRGI